MSTRLALTFSRAVTFLRAVTSSRGVTFSRPVTFSRSRVAARVAAALLAAAAWVAVIAPAANAADAGAIAWSVATVDGAHGTDRPNFSYVEDPGTVQRDRLRITNTGTTPLDLAVYAADAYTTPTGTIDLDTPDLTPDDAGAWITLFDDAISLAPGAEVEIGFRIDIPADANPGDHSAGIVTSLRSDDGGTLSVDRRLATRVSVRVSGDLAPAVVIDGLTADYTGTWNPFGDGVLRLDYRVTNTGNTRLTASDAVSAAGPFGLFARDAAAGQLPEVIPGSTIHVHHEIPATPWGLLTGAVTVDPEAIGLGAVGTGDSGAGAADSAPAVGPVTLSFEVVAVPWTLLALLALAAGAVVALVTTVRRRARPVRDAAAAPE